MKKTAFIVAGIIASFGSGFAFRDITTAQPDKQIQMKKVTGIGGIFFKCKDPKKMRDWYQTHLGLNTNQYGAVFEWRQGADTTKKGFTTWSPFAETTKYFEPSQRDFMINYRVENLEALVEQLQKEGVTIVDKIESYDYGKFVHIVDVEGNKIELWEPNDIAYEKLGEQIGSKTTK
jgi:predicted enzyme related to lactoylglutathione lyase